LVKIIFTNGFNKTNCKIVVGENYLCSSGGDA